MDKLFIGAILVVLGIYLSVIITVFHESLPYWCEHPEGNGNQLIQPLCK